VTAGSNRIAIGFALLAGLFVLGIVFTVVGGSTVQAGHVGVLTTWGKADNQPLDPGFHFIWPAAQTIINIDVRTQNHTFKEVNASSKELQSVILDGGVNYKIDPNKAVELYNTVGVDFAGKVFDPAFQDYMKEVVPQFTTTDILAHRQEIRDQAKQKLEATARTYGIDVLDVFITNISFSPDYTKAIEAKQVAAQQLEQAKIDAQKAAQVAQGTADAAIAKAKGDASATLTLAQAQAEANRALSASLTPDIIQYQIASKWDGHLPQVTGNSSPFISLTPSPKP